MTPTMHTHNIQSTLYMYIPNIKDVGSGHGRNVNVVARLVKKDFEVADYGVGSLPSFPHTTRLGYLDPALTSSAHSVVYVNTVGQLGWRQRRLSKKYK